MSTSVSRIALLAMLLATAACSSSNNDEKKAEAKTTAVGSLSRNLDMIDAKDGVHYGTVELNPVGGGRVFDADGRLIGHIVPPAPMGYAPPPPPAGYAPAPR